MPASTRAHRVRGARRALAAALCVPGLLAGVGCTRPAALAAPPVDAALPGRLRADVVALCGPPVAPRPGDDPTALHRTSAFIAQRFRAAGVPAGRVRVQRFRTRAGEAAENVIARLGPWPADGTEPRAARVVVGAHYDTALGRPGADDDASGVAALLELARALAEPAQGRRLARPVELVAYTLEEPPHFATPDMGSWHHAHMLRAAGANVALMVSVEMIGFYRDAPGSQDYPAPWLVHFFPDRGNFLALVGRWGQGAGARAFARGLMSPPADAHTPPVESLSLPPPGLRPRALLGADTGDDLSDQRNYWDQGYPAVMLTDTAFLRNPNYHAETDTPETLDYARLAGAVRRLQAGVMAVAAGQ